MAQGSSSGGKRRNFIDHQFSHWCGHASVTREPILLAAVAGLTAGALSMAAGEYVSVSSQSDVETADLKREKLRSIPCPKRNWKNSPIFIFKGD